jgi:parallel beta-helix repeat protein
VQAPATLTADSNGLFTLVEVGGGATSASIVNMGVSGAGPSSCGSINYGVFVTNANAAIVGNKVLSIRDNPYSGCQNGVAIRFGSQGLGFVGHTGTIAYNTVNDYQKGGIEVDGVGTNVSILGNVVTGQNKAGVNGQNGIQISRGALGPVNGNVVINNLYAAPPTPLNISAAGILVYDIAGGVTVTNNTVTGNDEGIGVYSDTTAATNVTVENNAVNKNAVVGIHADMYSMGNTIWMNTAQNNGVYDLADEHSDLSSNNWDLTPTPPYTVVTPIDSNTYGTVNVLPFSY